MSKAPDAAANFVLMMLVSMQDPGLVILPTHRLVSGMGDDDGRPAANPLLGQHFQVDTVGTGPAAAKEAWELIEADGIAGAARLRHGRGRHLATSARFQSPELMANWPPTTATAWRGLAVAVLHRLVLDKLVSSAARRQAGMHLCAFAARGDRRRRRASNASWPCWCRRRPMDHVEHIAGNLEKMPPKSTYFYPETAERVGVSLAERKLADVLCRRSQSIAAGQAPL